MRKAGWTGLAAALFLGSAWGPRLCRAGGTGDVKNVDELVATVEGEFITRRTLIRDVGDKNPEEDDRAYEQRLKRALYARAIRRIFVHAGELIGLTLTPDAIEDEVKWRVERLLDSARAQAEKDKPGSGSKITFERMLKEKGESMEEFRSDTAKDMTIRRYYYVLQQGVQGKRAIVDLEPTPEEMRRIFAAHRDDLAIKRGVRFAYWTLSPVAFLVEDAKPHFDKYDDAVAEAKRRAQTALVEFRRDGDAARIAKDFGLKDREQWGEIPKGKFISEDSRGKLGGFASLTDWVFDPVRRPGDAVVLDGTRGDFLAVVVTEVRVGKSLSFDEVKEDLAKVVRQVKQERFRGQHLLGLLGRAQVWPTSLAEELEDQQRAALAKLDEDPVMRDIRLP